MKQLYNDSLRAIHARVAHTRGCTGCDRCAAIRDRETQARAAYDTGLREVFG